MKGTLKECFRNKGGLSEQEKAKIKEAILAASSLEEVERLQQQLQAGIISFTGRNFIFNWVKMLKTEIKWLLNLGYIPGQEKKKAANEDEEEEDEEMEE